MYKAKSVEAKISLQRVEAWQLSWHDVRLTWHVRGYFKQYLEKSDELKMKLSLKGKRCMHWLIYTLYSPWKVQQNILENFLIVLISPIHPDHEGVLGAACLATRLTQSK